MSALKTMLLKELRECVPWAALLLVVTSGAITIGMATDDPSLYWFVAGPVIVSVAAAAGGLLLGILQVAREASADRWAFLVHRPLSTTRIFVVKAIAGLGLLGLAVGIPWGVSVLWCLESDRWGAPFYLEMAAPNLVDLAMGGAYYFAGMLAGLRRARWYGSRGLVLGLPLVGTVLVWVVPELWLALVVAAGTMPIGAVAARGVFLAGGQSAIPRRLPRVALAVHLYLGVLLVGVSAITFVIALCERPGPRSAAYSWKLLEDGRVVRQTWQPGGGWAIESLQGEYLGTHGDARTLEDVVGVGVREFDSVFWSRPDSQKSEAGAVSPFGFAGFLVSASFREPFGYYLLVGFTTGERWYYSKEERLFVAFDTRTGRRTGSLGLEGPVGTSVAPSARFPRGRWSWDGFGWRTLFTWPEEGVFELNFAHRSVTRLFSPSPSNPVLGVSRLGRSDEGRVAIVTEDRLRIVYPGGRMTRERPVRLPDTPRGYILVPAGEEGGPIMLQYSLPGARAREVITELAFDGSWLRSVEIPPWEIEVEKESPRFAWWKGAAGFSYPALAGPGAYAAAYMVPRLTDRTSFLLLGDSSERWGLALGAFLPAAVTLLLARRYAFSRGRCVLWVVVNALLGLAGLLVFWSLEEWPARETCPSCARKRVVTREGCEHCGASFPPPPRDGTEILETACSGSLE